MPSIEKKYYLIHNKKKFGLLSIKFKSKLNINYDFLLVDWKKQSLFNTFLSANLKNKQKKFFNLNLVFFDKN